MKNTIQINKTAKYVTYGNPKSAKTIIFALHGYGQLVEFFIRKFHGLNQNDYFIVAPEGLHRFYLKGSSGRVGASWMTKEERETDIQDYISYLDVLWDTLSTKYQFDKRILLGFSQGGATASRWHNWGNFNAHQFILWAAIFPLDMNLKTVHSFEKSNNYFVFGTEDEYYSEPIVDKQFKTIKNGKSAFKMIKFNGNHNIDQETLLNLV